MSQAQTQVVDLLERAEKSGISYTPDEIKKELYHSTFSLKGFNEFSDLNGEKIMILVGRQGVGKTACVHQFCHANEMECYAFNLGGTVQEDLHGNPDIKTLEDGTRVTGRAAAQFAPPFYRKPHSKSGKGIWLLDEIFSGSSVDHQLFVRMIAGRKCDELHMQDGWYIVGTTNPNSAEFMVVRKIDASTSDRFIIFPVMSNEEVKLAYWRGTMHPLTFKFLLLNHVKKLSYVEATSARNWWNLSLEIAKRTESGASVDSIEKILSTHISKDVAGAFKDYLKHGDDLRYFPIGCRELIAANSRELDALMKRVKYWITEDCTPLLGASKWDITAWMRDDVVKKNEKVTQPQVANLVALMTELGAHRYLDYVDDMLHACGGAELQQQLLDTTRGSPLYQKLIDILNAYKGKKK